jgi:hypothetical protein
MEGMVDPEVVIARLAARQHRVVTRAQLVGKGLSPDQVDRAVARKLLTRQHRGVYLVGGGEPSFEAKALAACWAAGGLASHRTAAALFGLRRVPRTYLEVTVERRPRAVPGVTSYETSSLTSDDRTRIGVVPVVRLPLILLQLASVAPQWASGALDDALVRHLTDLAAVERFLERAGRGRPGAALLRELVGLRRAGQRPTESVAEDEFVQLHRRFNRPVPERQIPARLASGALARFDFGGPLVDLEIDGARWHAGYDDCLADARRDADARAAGVAVARFTPAEIRDEPLRVLARARFFGLRSG